MNKYRKQFEKKNPKWYPHAPILDNYTTYYSDFLEQQLSAKDKEIGELNKKLESYTYMLEKYIGEDKDLQREDVKIEDLPAWLQTLWNVDSSLARGAEKEIKSLQSRVRELEEAIETTLKLMRSFQEEKAFQYLTHKSETLNH